MKDNQNRYQKIYLEKSREKKTSKKLSRRIDQVPKMNRIIKSKTKKKEISNQVQFWPDRDMMKPDKSKYYIELYINIISNKYRNIYI